MERYNFSPLTPNASIHGINIIFWINKLESKKVDPFCIPSTAIAELDVYPMQKPL